MVQQRTIPRPKVLSKAQVVYTVLQINLPNVEFFGRPGDSESHRFSKLFIQSQYRVLYSITTQTFFFIKNHLLQHCSYKIICPFCFKNQNLFLMQGKKDCFIAWINPFSIFYKRQNESDFVNYSDDSIKNTVLRPNWQYKASTAEMAEYRYS